MRIVRTIAEMHAQSVAWTTDGRRIGFVPTMGAFHVGHVSLMTQAREQCDIVVTSLFVNPTQFNEATDLAAYPRDEATDAQMASDAGVDLLFAPTADEMYPTGFATTIAVGGLEDVLEGAMRGPQHFRGVATVVNKLFNIVAPHAAFFGQKDAQQVAVIKRMVADLAMPVEIVVCDIVRESDGLAMSSRNVRLEGDDRTRALALWRGLEAAQRVVDAGERHAATVVSVGTEAMKADGIEPEYFVIVDRGSLAPLTKIAGDVLIAVAARVGPVRLIDNIVMRVS
ncbi:MAG TPA: pantoate--beta-alanine ligase [Gemmatimonadaceae bacterium]|jgi:pantoate--beta-alanine ligase